MFRYPSKCQYIHNTYPQQKLTAFDGRTVGDLVCKRRSRLISILYDKREQIQYKRLTGGGVVGGFVGTMVGFGILK